MSKLTKRTRIALARKILALKDQGLTYPEIDAELALRAKGLRSYRIMNGGRTKHLMATGNV